MKFLIDNSPKRIKELAEKKEAKRDYYTRKEVEEMFRGFLDEFKKVKS